MNGSVLRTILDAEGARLLGIAVLAQAAQDAHKRDDWERMLQTDGSILILSFWADVAEIAPDLFLARLRQHAEGTAKYVTQGNHYRPQDDEAPL